MHKQLTKTDDNLRPNFSNGKNTTRMDELRQKKIDSFNKKSPVRVFTAEELVEINKK